MVATRDIGLVAARALAEGPTSRVDVIELAGPKECSPSDIAAVFAKAVGRDVAPEPAPFDAVVPAFTSFGISKSVAGRSKLYRASRAARSRGKERHTRAVRGIVDATTVVASLSAD
jgi:uncharacterized protein YbjT (DUF2867 family)